jgi:hypothetical protein
VWPENFSCVFTFMPLPCTSAAAASAASAASIASPLRVPPCSAYGADALLAALQLSSSLREPPGSALPSALTAPQHHQSPPPVNETPHDITIPFWRPSV